MPRLENWGGGLKILYMLGVLCCFALFVCLTLLASFFLPSHISLKHVHCMLYRPHTLTGLQMPSLCDCEAKTEECAEGLGCRMSSIMT